MLQPVQQSDVDEFYIRPRYKKHSRALHVDAGGRGSGQSTVAQHNKFLTSRVTRAGVFKDFIRLKIHEAQTHGPAHEDSFQMSPAAATAEVFLGVQSDDRVPALPDSFAGRIAAKPNAIT